MRIATRLTRLAGGNDGLSDEAILNVFRGPDAPPLLTTAEVAEQLPITADWANTRLKKLESKGRVHSKSAGQGRVWSLDDGEPRFPVREGIGDMLWYVLQIREASTTTTWTGIGMFGVSGLFALVLFISYLSPAFFFRFYSSDSVVLIMWLAAIGGLMFILAGGLLRLVALGIPRLVAE